MARIGSRSDKNVIGMTRNCKMSDMSVIEMVRICKMSDINVIYGISRVLVDIIQLDFRNCFVV